MGTINPAKRSRHLELKRQLDAINMELADAVQESKCGLYLEEMRDAGVTALEIAKRFHDGMFIRARQSGNE